MNDNLLNVDDTQPPQLDPNKNYLAELVGEGKRFKTPEEMARGKYEADAYIKTLEMRMDELRSDYLKIREDNVAKANLKDLIDQLESKQQSASNTSVNETVKQPTIDPKEIESLVSSKIQEHELTKRQQENFDTVRTKLKERFGNNYQNILKEHIDTLGLTEDFVNDLARKYPSVLYKTLGLDTPARTENFQSPVRSNQSFTPSPPKERTWAYYQDIKKNNPRLYVDPKTTVQMHEDYLRLGDKFEDGDFHMVR